MLPPSTMEPNKKPDNIDLQALDAALLKSKLSDLRRYL
jgi:hypothetical protein